MSKAGGQETEKQSQCQRAGLGGESKQSDNVVGPECNSELPGSPCKRGKKIEVWLFLFIIYWKVLKSRPEDCAPPIPPGPLVKQL